MTKRTRTACVAAAAATASGLLLLSCYGPGVVRAFSVAPTRMVSSYSVSSPSLLQMAEENNNDDSSPEDDETKKEEAPAGSFFHPVPPPSDESSSTDDTTTEAAAPKSADDEFNDAINQLIQQRRKKPLASQPSTINGVPTATGFGKPKPGDKQKPKKKSTNPYVAIGTPDRPINDPSKPERDDQGYTLYTDTQTGEKSRVFEALVDYPSIFTMKIVGANEGTFVQEMVALVAEACDTDVDNVKHSTKVMGKWVSVTVKAPVQSAEMLYSLYEKVDLDPRVKFKF